MTKESPSTIGIINSSDTHKNDNSRIASHKPGVSVNKDNRRGTEPIRKTEEEIKKEMNAMIEKQNAEMLKLL